MTDAVEAAVEGAVQDAFTRAISNLHGTFSYERKVNLGNYESETYALFVQFDYPPGADMEEFLSVAREAARKAKAVVYEQAGIEAEDDAGGTLREVRQTVNAAFPGATWSEPSDGKPIANFDDAAPAGAVGPNPPYTRDSIKGLTGDAKKAAYKANNEWAAARYATNPMEFEDNRPAKASGELGRTIPDFSHKTHKVGFYDD